MKESEPYGIFARVYDQVMADIDYDEWTEFILTEVHMRGFTGGRILDLGCGTGNSAAPLLRRGYEVTGVDASEAMLAVARGKHPEATWLQGTFTDFSARGTFGLVQSVFDSLNNLPDDESFLQMARRVHSHLRPDGFFMFDVNTSFGLENLWEGGTVQGWLGQDWFGWKHEWDGEARIATVEAGFLIGGQAWRETHLERAFDQPELRRLLQAAGFTAIEMLEEPWGEQAEPDAARVWVITRPA